MQHLRDQSTAEMLKKAVKVVTRVEDPELQEMIHRFDYTPAPEIEIDVNDQMKIYNWLQELKMYRQMYGPIGG